MSWARSPDEGRPVPAAIREQRLRHAGLSVRSRISLRSIRATEEGAA